MKKLIVLITVTLLATQVFAQKTQLNEKQLKESFEKAKIEDILQKNGILQPGQPLESNRMLTGLVNEIYTIEKRENCASLNQFGYYLHNTDFSKSFFIAIKKSADGEYFYVYQHRNQLEYMTSRPPVKVECLNEHHQPKTKILYQRPLNDPFILKK